MFVMTVSSHEQEEWVGRNHTKGMLQAHWADLGGASLIPQIMMML